LTFCTDSLRLGNAERMDRGRVFQQS
jgi:hypothetical protein